MDAYTGSSPYNRCEGDICPALAYGGHCVNGAGLGVEDTEREDGPDLASPEGGGAGVRAGPLHTRVSQAALRNFRRAGFEKRLSLVRYL